MPQSHSQFAKDMGHSKEFSEKQRHYRGRSPLAMGGHVCQRSFLLILLGFFVIYTFVGYLSTRSILARCVELAATDVTFAADPKTSDSATPALKATDPVLDSEHEEQLTAKVVEPEKMPEAGPEEVTKSPKIAKVTMMYGPHAKDETMRLIIEGHREHAARHGHGIHILDRQLLHGLWSKHAWLMMVMLEEMQKPEDMRTKWLAWFDTDIIVMNPNIPLDIFLPPDDGFSHINLLATNDHNGLNNGAFMIRVGEWGVRYFADSLALHTYEPDMKLKYSEQSAMEYTITLPKYANKTMLVPQRWFNAYRGPRNENGVLFRGQKVPPNTIMPGDLQLHFAGKKTTKALMPLWVALASNESAGWSKPLKETKLPSEISLFWKLQKEKQDWNSPVRKPKKTESKTGKESHDIAALEGIEMKGETSDKPADSEDSSSLNAHTTPGKSKLVQSDREEVQPEMSEAEGSED